MKNILFVLISLQTLISCAQTTTNKGEELTKNIAESVSKSEFKTKMSSLTTYQLIDVRTPAEYAAGTIDNAINIDYLSEDFIERINALDKSIPVLMFCQSGGRSGKALKDFSANGFEIVYELKGGYGNW
jgi:rhodanese-related sulfurtransferase